jgi:hypothetical protein
MKFINLVGQKFGELEVIERAENDKYGNSRYLCRCSCGKEIIVDSSALKRGSKTSCGHKYQIEIGSKYGKLTVIKEIKNGGKYSYLCLCECGKQVIKSKYYLCRSKGVSCGCNRGYKTHGLSRSRIYKTWEDMKTRCYNPNCRNYHNYGGRGIIVCEEWKNDFVVFYNWAMANGYTDELTIERVDVNGNYCPENCTWISLSEQSKNKRPKTEWTP